jgi:4-hydroxy-3-methylbut-2-enyl diphosphate reductase
MAVDRKLRVIDATCPLVTKVHLEAVRFAASGATILLIGHRDHDEVIGTMGEAPAQTLVISTPQEAREVHVPDPERLFYLTQTTLSLDDARAIIEVLKQRFPKIQGPAAQDICYATENRQQAVKHIAPLADLLLVVGSDNSSNSKRLVEVGANAGLQGHLIDDETQVQPGWLEGVNTVAITAGASAPEVLVQRVVGRLRHLGFRNVQELEVVEEDVRFALPAELAPQAARLTQIAIG